MNKQVNIEINTLLRKYKLPHRNFNREVVLAELFKTVSKEFLIDLRSCNGKEFAEPMLSEVKTMLTRVKQSVPMTVRQISKILESFDKADLGTAQKQFDNMMKRLLPDLFITTVDGITRVKTSDDKSWYMWLHGNHLGNQFFRVRAVEYFSDTIAYNPDKLFHVPISKRSGVSNGRFSLAGFPSLYLSTMLPLAWQETGYPVKYYYSEFQYEYAYGNDYESRDLSKELKLIGLYSPNEIAAWGMTFVCNHFDLWLIVMTRYLKIFPLILACSFVNMSGDTPFKQEYIIPQMLMQWIQRNPDKAQGVSYFPCLDLLPSENKWNGYNIVIPAFPPHDTEGYSKKLKAAFQYSRPAAYTLPIIDKSKSANDAKILDLFSSDITNLLLTTYLPNGLSDCLREMQRISDTLKSVLTYGEYSDIRLCLQTLNLIMQSHLRVGQVALSMRIQQSKDDKTDPRNPYPDSVYDCFSALWNRFFERDRNTGEIVRLISKYTDTTWNYLHTDSHLFVYAVSNNDLDSVANWLKEHHYLFYPIKLTAEDSIINSLNEIAMSQGWSLANFFNPDVIGSNTIDADWVKANISSISSPIIVQHNNTNIYNVDTKPIGFVQIGFAEEELEKVLTQ